MDRRIALGLVGLAPLAEEEWDAVPGTRPNSRDAEFENWG